MYNFHVLLCPLQNHRRYVRSRDDLQLNGKLKETVSSDCEPFAIFNNSPIAPCGAIANSLFNGKLLSFCPQRGVLLIIIIILVGLRDAQTTLKYKDCFKEKQFVISVVSFMQLAQLFRNEGDKAEKGESSKKWLHLTTGALCMSL